MSTETDPDYAEWLREAEEECYCCQECFQDKPCEGVLAGFGCDNKCTCSEDYWSNDFWNSED
jgi:hypothetical protein